MHPKSPRVSAADGAVTLLYKMGKENWLEKLLDNEKTYYFKLVMTEKPYLDLYIQRIQGEVEVRTT